MQIAILDPFAGISGDMLLGAILDAGAPSAWLESLPTRLGLEGVQVVMRHVERCSVSAVKVDFAIAPGGDSEHHGRHISDMIRVVERAELEPEVRAHAIAAFEALGAAEGRVHGVEPHRVHLHEVGAVDAILDIVGVIDGFRMLGVSGVFHLPVALGSGWVDAAHGRLPVPAPATSYLLEGMEVRSPGPIVGEATTPTGAVLLKVLSRGAPPRQWRHEKTGWGAGTRDPKEYPNALRIFLATTDAEVGMVEVIATDIDDMVPEYLEPLREAAFAAGALDVSAWPMHGKKGRVAVRIEILTSPERTDAVIAALFANSTTAGVRRWSAQRSTLARTEQTVELPGGNRVRIKVWQGPGGVRYKPEFSDVMEVARALNRPALEIAREAERTAEAAFQNGQRQE